MRNRENAKKYKICEKNLMLMKKQRNSRNQNRGGLKRNMKFGFECFDLVQKGRFYI